MTLLTAVTNVAAEAGYSVDSAVIGSTDVTTKQFLAIANRVIREMSIAYPWAKLFKSGSITLATSTASYALPGDFSYYHFETFWNQSTRWRILGPISEQEYAEQQGYGINTYIYDRFQIRGVTNNQLTIVPTPGSGQNGNIVIFEYAADRPVRPMTWVTSTAFAAGTYCFYNGNYYTTTAGGTTGATAPTHTTGSASDGAVTWTYYSGTYPTFLADTDLPVLSDRVLEQGMLERFAEIHGLSVGQRFLDQLNEEFSKESPGKVLYAGGEPTGKFMAGKSGIVNFGGGY